LSILNAIDAQKGRLHMVFGPHKQWALAAKMARNPMLSVP